MKISFKIGTKLFLGFLVVVAIFGAVAYYHIQTLRTLGTFQDHNALRTQQALSIKDIVDRVDELYGVFADAIINRDLRTSREEFEQRKLTAQKDIASVRELVDTPEEKTWAEEFAAKYQAYLDLFEKEMLPVLEREGSAEKRFADVLTMNAIARRVDDVAAIIAAAEIHRNLNTLTKDVEHIRDIVQQDIAAARGLADTDEENVWIETFARQYTAYLTLFETQMLPLLKGGDTSDWGTIRTVDAQLAQRRAAAMTPLDAMLASLEQESRTAAQDTARIKELDGEIDNLREAVTVPLNAIDASLVQENVAADTIFNDAEQRSIRFSIIMTIAGGVVALLFAWLLTWSITKPLKKAVMLNNELSQGNLNIEIAVKRRDEIGQLFAAMRNMVAQLREIVITVKEGALNVSSGSQEMAQGASEQAAAAEEASSSMEQMSSNIRQNAENALQTEKIAIQSAAIAQEGGKAVAAAVMSIKEIARKIAVVEEIARQTHTLSLNATIEAAKAQEYGKGFAVVASEVRALSDHSRTAANEINELANTSVAVVERAGEILTKLVPDIQKTSELVQEISAATGEQSNGAEQINKAIQQLDQVIQQNASVSEELASQAEQLSATMEFFKLEEYRKTTRDSQFTRKKSARKKTILPVKTNREIIEEDEEDDEEGSDAQRDSSDRRAHRMNSHPARDEQDADFERY